MKKGFEQGSALWGPSHNPGTPDPGSSKVHFHLRWQHRRSYVQGSKGEIQMGEDFVDCVGLHIFFEDRRKQHSILFEFAATATADPQHPERLMNSGDRT